MALPSAAQGPGCQPRLAGRARAASVCRLGVAVGSGQRPSQACWVRPRGQHPPPAGCIPLPRPVAGPGWRSSQQARRQGWKGPCSAATPVPPRAAGPPGLAGAARAPSPLHGPLRQNHTQLWPPRPAHPGLGPAGGGCSGRRPPRPGPAHGGCLAPPAPALHCHVCCGHENCESLVECAQTDKYCVITRASEYRACRAGHRALATCPPATGPAWLSELEPRFLQGMRRPPILGPPHHSPGPSRKKGSYLEHAPGHAPGSPTGPPQRPRRDPLWPRHQRPAEGAHAPRPALEGRPLGLGDSPITAPPGPACPAPDVVTASACFSCAEAGLLLLGPACLGSPQLLHPKPLLFHPQWDRPAEGPGSLREDSFPQTPGPSPCSQPPCLCPSATVRPVCPPAASWAALGELGRACCLGAPNSPGVWMGVGWGVQAGSVAWPGQQVRRPGGGRAAPPEAPHPMPPWVPTSAVPSAVGRRLGVGTPDSEGHPRRQGGRRASLWGPGCRPKSRG
ncbi:hypothetical protein J0S82_019166 [Galemys pyrenaicus]|uniref:Uncharacterized protein n=1 Tax=Galemys pyrenaicus TaxID=202257 RepID=A0A8J6AP99_GALPY|nr:hypothetical protein J0S82_019166 [Galemys pyrenaicus]